MRVGPDIDVMVLKVLEDKVDDKYYAENYKDKGIGVQVMPPPLLPFT